MILVGDNLEWMRAQPGTVCDLAITSPPYGAQRTYDIGFKFTGQNWVDWMAPRVVEMCRVTDGLVFVNAAGAVKNFQYQPIVEWLVADLTRQHGIVCGPAPYVFQRVGIPGSGGKHYHRRDWEPVYGFARPECLPPKWSDNTAFGKPPKYQPGGQMSNRHTDGRRKKASAGPVAHNRWGAVNGSKLQTRRKANGERARDGLYLPPSIANPGNVISLGAVGGGNMGDMLCHENEAPFPESLVERFIRWYCPPGGTVMDCFCGSGTTLAVARKLGRKFIGIDIRESQAEIARKRCAKDITRELV